MLTLYYQVDSSGCQFWEFPAVDDTEALRIARSHTSDPFKLTAFAYIIKGIGKIFFESLAQPQREFGTIWHGDLEGEVA